MAQRLSEQEKFSRATGHGWVVHHYSPLKHALRVTVTALLIASAGCGLFALGRASVNVGNTVREQYAEGDQRLAKLREDNAVLREQAAILKRTSQVERAAYNHIDQSLKQLQDEVLKLTEELAVYKSIVVHMDSAKGIAIHNLRMRPEKNENGLFRYQVVLTHFGTDQRVVSGTMDLRVSGTQNGRTSSLSLAELAGTRGRKATINLEFKNFHRVEGLLRLPEDFTPRYVRVRVDGQGKRQQAAERTFTWAQAAS